MAQGKVTLKVGIDPKPADTTWLRSQFTPKCAYGEGHYCLFAYPEATTSQDPKGTPCWSVNALMNLLPRVLPDPLDENNGLPLTIQPTMSACVAFMGFIISFMVGVFVNKHYPLKKEIEL